MEIRKKLARLAGWEYFWLCLIVVITVVMHFTVITRPPELILDEQHYVPDARSIVQDHKDLRPEHPTLGKIIIGSGIVIFGDNPVGWRAPSLVFGTLGLIFAFLIFRRLHMSKRAVNLAIFLLAFENMTFIQASVAMLDVFYLTFMLAALWLYLRKNYSLAAVAIGLSALSKLTGALGIGIIGLHWLVMNRATIKENLESIGNGFKRLLVRKQQVDPANENNSHNGAWQITVDFIASMLLAPFSFMIFMPVSDYIAMHEITNPLWRVKEMMSLMSTLTFATTKHDSLSRPWDWLISPRAMPYWYVPSYMGGISYTIWALIVPAVLYLIYRAWKGNNAAIFGVMWFICTYIIWIPASIITDRISFVFYFYQTIPAICIGLALAFSQFLSYAKTRKNALRWVIPAGIGVFLLGHIVVLAIISPVFT